MHPIRVLALAAALPGAAVAQQARVVPAGMANLEGPSLLTYPFGRTDAALQVLIESSLLTQTQGLVLGLSFRQSQQTQSTAGYTKPYRVTMWTVPIAAAQMAADPAANVGASAGTVVFDGPLTLPAVAPLAEQPAPFLITIPFTTPYPYDGSQGNLLFVVETTDQTTTTGTYRIDAVLFRNSTITGLVAPIDMQGCTALGSSLTSSTAEANAIVGGSIDTTVTAAPAGVFPTVLTALSFGRQDVDLTPLGLPGCTSRIGAAAFQVLLPVAGTYPPVLWAVPPTTSLEGVGLITQSLGLTAQGLVNAVVSNAEAIRIGASVAAPPRINASFRGTGSWSPLGNAGEFAPVMSLDGVFP